MLEKGRKKLKRHNTCSQRSPVLVLLEPLVADSCHRNSYSRTRTFPMLRLISVVVLALSVVPISGALAGEVKFQKKDGAVVVTIDGREFTTYHTDKSQMKPYLD